MDVDILVAAGGQDPNTATILAAAETRGLSVCRVVPDAGGEPAVTWDPVSGSLCVGGERIRATGAFLRYDVFGPGGYTPDQGRADRALAWFSTLSSWAFADPSVRVFNRRTPHPAGLKGYAIARAVHHGVPSPKTILSNVKADIESIAGPGGLIAKPAGGGAYAAEVDDLLDEETCPEGTEPAPAIVQERLSYPEVRVFLVGGTPFVFETYASTLDFRADRQSRTAYAPPDRVPADLLARLGRLAGDLGLDFCAYDLKTRAETGELCFLEVNSGPMFSAFDALAGGALSAAMVDWLAGRSIPAALAAE